jgi:uncharacterized protein YciI
MAHFLMEYQLVDDYLDRRPPLRPEHLALATAALERGDLLLAGALADPVDRAVFVFTDGTAAEEFARADPYVREGLVQSWTVRPWTVVVGEGAAPVV